MLLATLSRLGKVLGAESYLNTDVTHLHQSLFSENKIESPSHEKFENPEEKRGEDLGEVVDRKKLEKEPEEVQDVKVKKKRVREEPLETERSTSSSTPTTKLLKKRKKKKGDEFDDLFSALI
jgi:hypothetical protein